MDRQTDGRLTIASPRSALASRGKNEITTCNNVQDEHITIKPNNNKSR